MHISDTFVTETLWHFLRRKLTERQGKTETPCTLCKIQLIQCKLCRHGSIAPKQSEITSIPDCQQTFPQVILLLYVLVYLKMIFIIGVFGNKIIFQNFARHVHSVVMQKTVCRQNTRKVCCFTLRMKLLGLLEDIIFY